MISLVLTFVLELINQRSLADTLRLVFLTPHIFLINYLIVALIYSVSLFFKRKLFIYTLITFLLCVIGAINLVLLIQRNTQFNASDIIVFQYGMFITMKYFNLFKIILVLVAAASAVFGMVMLYRKGFVYPQKPDYKRSAVFTVSAALICTVLILIGEFSGFLDSRFIKIDETYKKNGFVYSFCCTAFVKGVEEPEKYDKNSVQALASELDYAISETDKRPNVIFVQLESFIDPSEIKGLDFESDPVPNFSELQENYPSGYLTVPVVGGGTANTEFEILTGMNLEHFGSVELPYNSFLLENTCESMAYNYKELGYKAHAIHNYNACFYKRDRVYANLGFDTFTTIESMSDIVYNDIGWAKDEILERYILSALSLTKESDMIFAVSVQGHGSYPTDFDDLQCENFNEDLEENEAAINYYISQIREMDDFVGGLVDTLREYEEDTVVVFYGDHLPGINIDAKHFKRKNLYETEYVIWSNFELGAKESRKDLYSYQLSAYVQELLGFSSGTVTKFHQQYSEAENYQELLKRIEYDIKEGEDYIYNGKNPYKPTDIEFGIEKTEITDIEYDGKALSVKGSNFNEASVIYINGKKKDTEYIDSSTIILKSVKLEDSDKITVVQIDNQYSKELSKTKPYNYEASLPEEEK